MKVKKKFPLKKRTNNPIESNEPIHILLLAATMINLEKAKVLVDRLLVHVRNEFIKYM